MNPVALILLIVLIVILFGSAPWYPYSAGWGYAPSGTVLVLIVVLLVLALMGRV